MLKLLKLLVLCDDKIYTKAIARHIMILIHQRRSSKVTSWAYLTETNFNLLNEEIGEISLSILQRSLLRSSFKRDITTVSHKYRNLSGVVEMMGSQVSSLSSKFANDRNYRRILSADSRECLKMREFLELKLDEIRKGNVVVYGNKKGFESLAKGIHSILGTPKVKRRFGKSWLRLKKLILADQKKFEASISSIPKEVTARGKDIASDNSSSSSSEGTQ